MSRIELSFVPIWTASYQFIGRLRALGLVGVALVLLAVSVCNPSLAGPMEDAKSAYARKDYARAVAIWKDLAEKGDAESQGQLGTMYEMGKGVPQSSEVANLWFEKSAQQGNAVAQFLLATNYAKGRGVATNIELARNWYERSADQGYPLAQLNLGRFILSMSEPGRDPVLAFKWLDLAATNKLSPDYVLEWASVYRDELIKEMDSAQIDAGRRLVGEWRSRKISPE